MIRHKRLIRKHQHQTMQAAKFPLAEGAPEVRNIFGNMKRWNDQTGKYDIDA